MTTHYLIAFFAPMVLVFIGIIASKLVIDYIFDKLQ